MRQVFVDSNAWIACIVRDDPNHEQASAYLRQLRHDKILLVTSNYVKAETITWLKYHVTHQVAQHVYNLWQQMEERKFLQEIWVNPDIASKAWLIFNAYHDHSFSFTDCTSFAICQARRIHQVFTFDHHFNVVGHLLSPGQLHEHQKAYHITCPI